MISIQIVNKSLFSQTVDAYLFFLAKDFEFQAELREAADRFFPELKQFMHKEKFTGSAGACLTIPISDDQRTFYLIFVGMGAANHAHKYSIEQYRRALGRGIKTVHARKLGSVAYTLPDAALFGATPYYMAQQTAIIARMASYQFDIFITDTERKNDKTIALTLIAPVETVDQVQQGVDQGLIIGQATNLARYWVDMPPSMLPPTELAAKARDIAHEAGLAITVFNEQQINEMGMGGLAAVSRGSELDCNFVIMEYKTTHKDAPTVAFVGKGITFDSGGLSLKTAGHMETMKVDMSGAAAVIATMKALGQLKPVINIVALAPISENLPSGSAIKPGDVARFYNGKTAEIKNTDAEGRLILADALSYAIKHYKPDAIIDLATLTGACAHALGPFFSGLLSQHEPFVAQVMQAAERSGDAVWRLPLTADYKAAIKSDIADMSNIGGPRYLAGATTAACFLQNFVGQTPWVHLDIAGTASEVPDISYYGSGATGVGVRLLVQLAMDWGK